MLKRKHSTKFKTYLRTAMALLMLVTVCFAWQRAGQKFSNLWRTPDQQGQSLMDQNDYSAAAEKFQNAMRQGAALYKAGQFEKALKTFNAIVSPESVFNRGNCQIMLGKYDAAIELYTRAIELRPEWQAAIENRDLAIARKALMAPPDDDAGGTDGKLGANEIVFDNRAKNSKNEEVIETGTGDQLSDDEMRALWLHQVQTRPADFLRNKFAYQLQFEESIKEENKK